MQTDGRTDEQTDRAERDTTQVAVGELEWRHRRRRRRVVSHILSRAILAGTLIKAKMQANFHANVFRVPFTVINFCTHKLHTHTHT